MKSDPKADPPYKGMTCFITEKEPGASVNTGEFAGLTIPPKIKKMGYKGVESTELVYDGYRCPPRSHPRWREAGLGKGFYQMMDALEVGRVNVAARGVGIAQRAFELGIATPRSARRSASRSPAPGDPVQARRHGDQGRGRARLMVKAARKKDAGRALRPRGRHGEAVRLRDRPEVVEDSFRIHGGYGYSKEYEIERLYRDAPMLLIGEGTAEIQRMVIGAQILELTVCSIRAAAGVGRRAALAAGLLGPARERPRRAPPRCRCCPPQAVPCRPAGSVDHRRCDRRGGRDVAAAGWPCSRARVACLDQGVATGQRCVASGPYALGPGCSSARFSAG
jgi:hypothetical protein